MVGKRDRTIYMTRLLTLSLFVPFICAFLGHMKTDQQSIQDRIGLMYQSVGVPTYVGILIAVGCCKYIVCYNTDHLILTKMVQTKKASIDVSCI
jgi:hypothetical protein